MKKNQQRIRMILESKKIPFEAIDIALQSNDKDKMREIVGDPKALPPQVCNGITYCGVSITCLLLKFKKLSSTLGGYTGFKQFILPSMT